MIIAKENIALKIIKESIVELLPESSILLFGSRARNENSEDSDYDLMIITKDTYDNKELRLIKSKIRKKLAKERIPVDLIIQSKSEVETNKNIIGHIVRQVLKEGVPL